MDDTSNGDDRSNQRYTQAILALLDRQGVDVRKRIGTLEFAANLTYQQVRRRLLGEADWLPEDLRNIAASFDEPSLLLIEPAATKAEFDLAGRKVPCLIWLDLESNNQVLGPLWARPGDEGEQRWTVVHSYQRQPSGQWSRVKRLLFEPAAPARVALLSSGNDEDIVPFLRSEGLDVISCNSVARFKTALESKNLSAVVLPWRVSGDVVGPTLLDAVRKRSDKLPLIVLLDVHDFGGPGAEEVQKALSKAQALFFILPVKASTLFNAISSALGRS